MQLFLLFFSGGKLTAMINFDAAGSWQRSKETKSAGSKKKTSNLIFTHLKKHTTDDSLSQHRMFSALRVQSKKKCALKIF